MKLLQRSAMLALLALAGCLTPEAQRERRIAQNIDLFYDFPESVREAVRRGEVDIGFDEDMVRLALGSPDRVSRRKDEAGESVLWQYYRSIRHTDYQTVRMPVPYTDSEGRSRIRYEWVTVDHDYWERELRMQVEFGAGKVVTVETVDGH